MLADIHHNNKNISMSEEGRKRRKSIYDFLSNSFTAEAAEDKNVEIAMDKDKNKKKRTEEEEVALLLCTEDWADIMMPDRIDG